MADGMTPVRAPRSLRAARWLPVLLCAWTAFAVLAVVVAGNGWAPFAPELAAVEWGVAHRPPAARASVIVVTWFGTGPVPYLLALAAGLVAVRGRTRMRGRVRSGPVALLVPLLAPVLWLAVGQLLRQGLMRAFARPRPPVEDWAFTASGHAFPSGHAFTATVSAGLLAIAVARALPGAARAAAVGAALFAVVIGLSRVYLGVHWPLDVLGGWLLAVGWLAPGAALLAVTGRQEPPPRTLPDLSSPDPRVRTGERSGGLRAG